MHLSSFDAPLTILHANASYAQGFEWLNHRDQQNANNMYFNSDPQGGTSMQVSRADFGWRAAWAVSFFPEKRDKPVDDNGHNTHVAGSHHRPSWARQTVSRIARRTTL